MLAAPPMPGNDPSVTVLELSDPCVIAEDLAFPEGPVVLPDGSVAVVEMWGGLVTRCEPGGRKSALARVGGGPNGGALGPDGKLYICNNGGRSDCRRAPAIQRVDLDSGEVEDVYTDCDGRPLQGPNDIVFDETGGFWFSDLPGGAIYYASPDGSRIQCLIDGIRTPNGVGLSPDGNSLYWAETYTRQVMTRPLEGPGNPLPSPGYTTGSLIRFGAVDPHALLVSLPGGQELDSLAVEAGGAVCIGTLLDSGITVVEPDGRVIEKHVLPERLVDGAVTNICFGGEDLRTAYITLSITGRLISCRWPRPGMGLHFPNYRDRTGNCDITSTGATEGTQQ